MLEISFLQALNYILLNLFIPFFPGLLFLWIFFGNKFKGFFLYLISWFAGFGVVAFSLFNIQFFHFGIGKIEYFLILFSLIFGFFLRLKLKKENLLDFLNSLKISFSLKFLKEKFLELTKIEKIFFSIGSVFLTLFIGISFAHNLTFPTYFDDSFNNWNKPAANIFYDGGFKLFGEKDEILGHGRLGYPIYLPLYKALIFDFVGYWNDIYSNLFQYLVFLFGIFFTILISFKKIKSIFYSIIPALLICGLPIVYFHAIDGYLEIPTAVYSVLTIYFLFKFLEKNDFDYFLIGIFFGFILSSLKNDGIVVYFAGIILGFLTFLFLEKKFFPFFKNIFLKQNLLKISFFSIFGFLPFLIVKAYYGLGFNQAAGESSGVGIEKIHTEILPIYKHIFLNQDNYNISLVFIVLFVIFYFKNKSKSGKMILLSVLFIFLIINLVFLITSNYRWVMDQTTVNRVFSMIMLIFFSFSSYFLTKNNA